MKFWEKFWKLVNKQYLIFGLVLFAFVIGTSLIESVNKVKVSFDEDAVNIHTSRFYSMNIPYDMVESLELAAKPDMGTKIDGYTDGIIANGLWNNDAWGDYTACIEVYTDNCILVHLTDGRLFVLSRRNNEETQRVYEEFLTYVN